MADLLLHKLRKLACHAGFPLCSMGIGDMLPELALHKTCNSSAATELMDRRKKDKGKRHEYTWGGNTSQKKQKHVSANKNMYTYTQCKIQEI